MSLGALFLLFLFTGAPAAAAPRLLVVVSVDQLRPDYLERFGPELKGGLARLLREGAVYTAARHAHVPTETAPGHAAILTGRSPGVHGIVANTWWDREAGKEVYAVEDPVFGRSPANLLTYTLGDVMKAADPDSQVIALSMKDRASILLGGKRPDSALWWDKKSGAFTTSRYYGKLPAWAVRFNGERRVDARWRAVDARQPPPKSYYADLLETPYADELLAALAEAALGTLRLGADDHPDLLAVSFSATDYIGHRWGPDSAEVRAQVLSLDAVLEGLLRAFDQKVGPGRYAVALTADHGVCPLPEAPEARERGFRRANAPALIRALETALAAEFPRANEGPWVLGLYDAHIFLDHARAARLGIERERLVEAAVKALRAMDSIGAAYSIAATAGGAAPGEPYEAVYRRSHYAPRAGDVVYRMKEGVLLSWESSGTGHGQPYDYDARVPLLFWGAGIRPGRHATPALVTDLAPTAARVLGVPFAPDADSRVLAEALAP